MNEMAKIVFPVSIASVGLAEDIFEAITRNITSDERLGYRIRTALSEAFNNAILYCDKHSPTATIEFDFCFNNDKFVASVINEGAGFADKAIKWNDFPSEMAESGRGLKIIKKLSDKVKFIKHENNKFEVYMEFSTGAEQKISK